MLSIHELTTWRKNLSNSRASPAVLGSGRRKTTANYCTPPGHSRDSCVVGVLRQQERGSIIPQRLGMRRSYLCSLPSRWLKRLELNSAWNYEAQITRPPHITIKHSLDNNLRETKSRRRKCAFDFLSTIFKIYYIHKYIETMLPVHSSWILHSISSYIGNEGLYISFTYVPTIVLTPREDRVKHRSGIMTEL